MQQLIHDIYISFAKEDNQAEDLLQGWVSHFKRFLQEALLHILGEVPRFIFYPTQEKPSRNTLQHTALLICIVSPAYLRSATCIEDIEQFWELNHESHTSIPINKKIFKVLRLPVEQPQEPSKIRDLIGYKFYKRDEYSGKDTPIQDFFEDIEAYFWTRLIDFSHDVAYALQQIKQQSRQGIGIQRKDVKTIYLSETSEDLVIQRSMIKRELYKQGYHILPDQALPGNLAEMQLRIKRDLERSDMAIHLIGHHNGETIGEEYLTIVELQNRLSAEHSNLKSATRGTQFDDFHDFRRLIWLRPDMKFADERQRMFVDNIRQNADTLEGAEILQVPLEDLKTAIKRTLAEMEEQEQDRLRRLHEASDQYKGNIYLIYDKTDASKASILASVLEERGLKVSHPIFDGNVMQLRKNHIENLVNCDAAMIYYGDIDKQWVLMKLLDLLKSSGFGRKKAWQAKAIITEKPLDIKEQALMREVEIIENTVAFGAINNFLAKMV